MKAIIRSKTRFFAKNSFYLRFTSLQVSANNPLSYNNITGESAPIISYVKRCRQKHGGF